MRAIVNIGIFFVAAAVTGQLAPETTSNHRIFIGLCWMLACGLVEISDDFFKAFRGGK